MAWICDEDEVKDFLRRLHSILKSGDEKTTLVIVKENRPGDKTSKFMRQYNITSRIIYEELLKLDITNYSYTDYDDNPRYNGETVWIFGQIFEDIEVYIKLKIRDGRRTVVCLSFHEAEYDLDYPYL
ncbi:MAG: hypothetical protein PWP45_611 [Tepidanaerobacteraceae bacterium]|uniref:Toxin n=1 Tax=Fervidicola ferrireducens TaxID=520764 RepID=A0A140LE92_9FIRM|nr:hypothetical protein [Fervidicola ferrireducens]KXG78867.1 hypothetical protein AN618_02050 [Fervidicola ferrireducens]MDN5331386.1 hypothetical protein [Tepidanaerobacteraceae bacterium]